MEMVKREGKSEGENHNKAFAPVSQALGIIEEYDMEYKWEIWRRPGVTSVSFQFEKERQLQKKEFEKRVLIELKLSTCGA